MLKQAKNSNSSPTQRLLVDLVKKSHISSQPRRLPGNHPLPQRWQVCGVSLCQCINLAARFNRTKASCVSALHDGSQAVLVGVRRCTLHNLGFAMIKSSEKLMFHVRHCMRVGDTSLPGLSAGRQGDQDLCIGSRGHCADQWSCLQSDCLPAGYNDVYDDAQMGWARYAHSMRVFALNSGLFYIRPTLASLDLLDRVSYRLDHEDGWDQAIFNEASHIRSCMSKD